jgi:hypothetical protein
MIGLTAWSVTQMLKKSCLVAILLAFSVIGGLSTAQETVKIGAVFDRSGPTSDMGNPYADGVIAYVDWVNSNGGIEGQMIELCRGLPTSERRKACMPVRAQALSHYRLGCRRHRGAARNVAADHSVRPPLTPELNDPG